MNQEATDSKTTAGSSERDSTVQVDVRGKRCPIPMMRAKAALRDLSPGDRVHVIATDPDSVEDFRMLHQSGGFAGLECSRREEEGRRVYDFFITR